MKRLLALTFVIAVSATAAAAAQTVIYSGVQHGSYPDEPHKLKYSAAETDTQQSIKLLNLDWTHWGSDKATSSATATICSDAAGCFTTDAASVKAKKLVELDTVGYYTKLVVSFGQNAIKFSLPTP
jgi:hypothetical protein